MISIHRISNAATIAVLLAVSATATHAAVVLRGGVVGIGGGAMAGPGYGVRCAVGQAVSGRASGSGPGLTIGFLPVSDSDYSPVDGPLPSRWHLADNYPNPFNPRTIVRYQLPAPAQVRIGVYDLRGRLVHELVAGFEDGGEHEVIWNGDDGCGCPVASGLYFVRLESSEAVMTRKMILAR